MFLFCCAFCFIFMETDENAILKSLQCTTCLDFVPEKHYVCASNGRHRMCEPCYMECAKKTNYVCTVCKSSMVLVNESMFANIYSFFKVDRHCIYSKYGCNKEMKQAEFVTHPETCPYRPIPCSNINCKFMFNSNDTVEKHIEHLRSSHGVLIYNSTNDASKISLDVISVAKVSDDIFALLFMKSNRLFADYYRDTVSTLVIQYVFVNRICERQDTYNVIINGTAKQIDAFEDYKLTVNSNTVITKPSLHIRFGE